MSKALEKARADALRQRFILGGAMADIQRAAEELKDCMEANGIPFEEPVPQFEVIDGTQSAEDRVD